MIPRIILRLSGISYWLLLQLYPDSFRQQFGDEMRDCFRRMLQNSMREHGVILGPCWAYIRVLWDLVPSLAEQYMNEFRQIRANWGEFTGRHTRRAVVSIMVAVSLAFAIRASVAEAFEARTDSVKPDLRVGDRALVYRWATNFSPGEIVVFKNDQEKFRFGRVGQQENFTGGKIPIERFGKQQLLLEKSQIVGTVIFSYRVHPAECAPDQKKKQKARNDKPPAI
ncbi:MAG: hypothetical protein CMJ78_20575 [Planctomycetaceae bacterium]|nr:hypothetical protein [Planctomycetaceae bacterium]